MTLESISLIGVIGATIASIVIGFIWYGPLFGKLWITMMGWTPEEIDSQKQSGMAKSYTLMTLGSLVSAYILGNFVQLAGAVTAWDGITVGFFAWLGFAVPLLLSSVIWEGKPWKLYGLNTGYQLAAWCAMGAILAIWA